MIRDFVLLLKILAFAGIAWWLAVQPGHVVLHWRDWRLDTSIGVLIAGLLAFAILIALFIRLWQWLRRAPGQMRRNWRLSRREKGYRMLTQGLAAAAAGDGNRALRLSRKAENLLDGQPLTMLLSAQAAQLAGDDMTATRHFTTMLEHQDTAMIGLRGLIRQAVQVGDRDKALKLAQQARKEQPDAPWVLRELAILQQEAHDWNGALDTISTAIKNKALTRKEGERQKAVLLLEKCRQARDEGETVQAIKLAAEAVRLDPSLIPAVTEQARLLAAAGKLPTARRVLEKAWRTSPSLALASAYRDIGANENPLKQAQRFEKLLELTPGHPEAHLALARAALDASLWGVARRHLTPYAEQGNPSPRVCRMMAELEEGEHQDKEAARNWLKLAADRTDNGT